MKLTNTQLVGFEKTEGRLNAIYDDGASKKYYNKLYVYCKNEKLYGHSCFTAVIYFNDMNEELYFAIEECLGDMLFSDMKHMNSMIYEFAFSKRTHGKIMEYINKYAHFQFCITSIVGIKYIKLS